MAEEGIRVEGLEEAQQGVSTLVPDLMIWGDRRVEVGAGRVIQRTSKYPPPLPASSYERTGIYGATFTLKKLGQARFEATSNAEQHGTGYSPFVGGGEEADQQASIHAGRWPVFLEKMEKEGEEIRKDLNKEAIKQIRNKGL